MATSDSFSEDDRLRALHGYDVLDTPAEAAFESLARAAACLCATPMATVSLVDAERQWFKAHFGLKVCETPRDVSFCARAMHGDELFVVCDTHLDPRFRDNRLVTGEPWVRFYAGAPIRASNGAPLGALCVLDTQPHPQGLTPEQANVLRVLADQVEPHLRLRLAVQEREAVAQREHAVALASLQREGRLLSALESAEVGWWDWDVAADVVVANAEMARDYGIDPGVAAAGVPIEAFFANIHPHDRAWLGDAIADAQRTGEPFREEYRLMQPDGGVCWTSARGRCLADAAGRPARFPGISVDITDRKRTEEKLRESDTGRELAMDAARLGRFDHDLVEGRRFYDARALDMFGLTLEEAQSTEVLFACIHSDDRQRVIDAQARPPTRSGAAPIARSTASATPRTGRSAGFPGRPQPFQRRRLHPFHGGARGRHRGEAGRGAPPAADPRAEPPGEEYPGPGPQPGGRISAGATDPTAARLDIAGRIQALSRAHDLLTAQSWSAASADQVVEEVVGALSLPRERLEILGGPVQLGPKPALQLTLALHELATNALKYGALSNGSGVIHLEWGVKPREGAEVFHFDWIERGGPTVRPPSRRGFGSRLIERATAAEFDGEIELDYAPGGVRWRLSAPYAGLAERGRSDMPTLD